MMNLIRPDRGMVEVFGLNYNDHEVGIKSKIGYVGEHQYFYEDKTARWNADFIKQFYPSWDERLFIGLMNKFVVDIGKKVKDLSRGTRVKFALGVALAYRPRLLILDEPTSGLDPVARQEILSQLLGVVQDEERAVIFSSHITQDVEKIADYITFIRDGQVVLAGVKDDILDGWKRVLFRLEDGKVTPDWPKEFVALTGSGSEYKGVVSGFSPGLQTFLQEQGAADVRIENLSLDEIFLALVKGVC